MCVCVSLYVGVCEFGGGVCVGGGWRGGGGGVVRMYLALCPCVFKLSKVEIA